MVQYQLVLPTGGRYVVSSVALPRRGDYVNFGGGELRVSRVVHRAALDPSQILYPSVELQSVVERG